MWTPAGASIVHVPLANFAAQGAAWSATGSCFVLHDREAFCCAYLQGQEQVI